MSGIYSVRPAEIKIQAMDRGQQLRNKQLLEAAYSGDISKVKNLLARGANVNVTGNNGTKPLHIAAIFGDLEIAKLLINKGADINANDNGVNTALHWAVHKSYKEIVQLLVKAGANLDTRDYEGRTPLQLTQYIGNEISVKNAIEEGKTQLIKLVKEMPTKIEETLKSLDKLRNLPAEIIKIIVDDYFNPEQKEQAKKYIEEREEAAAATKIQMRIFVVS